MPALSQVSFVSTHADGKAPTCNGNGHWTLKFPANAETCEGRKATTVDLHQTLSIPVGYVGIISPNNGANIGATPGGYVNAQIIPGLGTPVALKLQVVNIGVASTDDFTPAADAEAARLIVVKQDQFKVNDTPGTW